MKNEETASLQNTQLAEIERLINEFKEKFRNRTSNESDFITINEIESMWSELQNNTHNIYSDMVRELMSSVNEKELIRKKKGSTPKKG